jgi:hypothetical protein
MNIKLLRKLRKRYKFYWRPNRKGVPELVALDTKKERVGYYESPADFLVHYAYTHIGFGTATAYVRRLLKRENLVEYKQKLKESNISPYG